MQYRLQRYPDRATSQLQAWDSADELLLSHLGYPLTGLSNDLRSLHDLSGKRILIVADSFGALSCALEGLDVTTYTDSYVSFRGIQLNSEDRIRPVSRLSELTGHYDYALIKIPKNMSFFEDLLCHLSRHLHTGSQVICGYMIKHQAKTSFELLNQLVGDTQTSLAQKKARLIFASFQRSPIESPHPREVSLAPFFERTFTNHSNLFSRDGLDIGTRFLLEHIPEGDFPAILDLGCGNGALGIAAKRKNPSARIIFSDESRMAIESATTNYARFFTDPARFVWTNGYEHEDPSSVSLVLCNPPFHQGSTQGDFIARQMFTDARHALVAGGILRVVGNSHLRYEIGLKRLFGNSRIVATNRKFMIVDAVKE